MVRYYFIFILLISGIFVTKGQNSEIDDINYYADIVNNAYDLSHKKRANKSLIKAFEKWISDPMNVYEESKSLKFLSVTSPEDQAFILVSWQLKKESGYDYFGYLYFNDQWQKLHAADYGRDVAYEIGATDDWLGAIYYAHHKVMKDDKAYYVLFGYHGLNSYENLKIAEVLSFEDDQAIFGSEIFHQSLENKRPDIKNRLILRYASSANATINYKAGIDMILQDHLILRSVTPGQAPTYLPDGSYVGWKWDDSKEQFEYVEKVYNQISATPPMSPAKKGKQKKDLFGRGK